MGAEVFKISLVVRRISLRSCSMAEVCEMWGGW